MVVLELFRYDHLTDTCRWPFFRLHKFLQYWQNECSYEMRVDVCYGIDNANATIQAMVMLVSAKQTHKERKYEIDRCALRWTFTCNRALAHICSIRFVSHRQTVSGDAVWRWHFCGKKRLAIYKMYGTITKPWRVESRLLLKERKLPDPYFWPILDLCGRLTEERKYVFSLLAVPKHRSKKRRWNRCNANCGKWNLKRLGMCYESKFGGESCLFGWPIARPHSWPMFWPIRD